MTTLGTFEFKPEPQQIDISEQAKVGKSEVFSRNSNKRYGLGSNNENINISGVLLDQNNHNFGSKSIDDQKSDIMNMLLNSPINNFTSPTTGQIETVILNVSFDEEAGSPNSVAYEINLKEV